MFTVFIVETNAFNDEPTPKGKDVCTGLPPARMMLNVSVHWAIAQPGVSKLAMTTTVARSGTQATL